MSQVTGYVFCPHCGTEVKFGTGVRAVQRDGMRNLWIQLYDAKPFHNCKEGDK